MPITAAGLAGASIRFDPASLALQHAREELRQHLSRVSPSDSGTSIELIAGPRSTEGFEITVRGSAAVVAGDSPRGALNGVYWLLEQVGFVWVRPGEQGTRFVPDKSLADGAYREAPRFPRRTLILGCDALHDEWPDWFEFASRNRLNSVFFHDTPPSILREADAIRPASAQELAEDGKGWLFERWDEDGSRIRDAAALRGMTLQFGGHHLPTLLRRELFDEHPDWFPFRAGGRDRRYNLCTSSRGAAAELRARARDFFARFAGAEVYHLWADDITGGGWCECPDCSGLTPSDQALRATNILAEVLGESVPSAAIAHLAYHDTIEPPRTVAPEPNVSALYAPRNRNYAFPIGDSACRRNAEHYTELRALASTFAARPDALAVFEYYSDAVLYKWMDPPNLQVLPRDADHYAAAGVHDFGDLAVSPRPWLGPTWHAWWFARCAWEPQPDAGAALARFCEAAYGADGLLVARAMLDLDGGYRELLDLGDLECIPRHDVLDFSDRPRDALARKARQLKSACEVFDGVAASLALVRDGLARSFREDLAVSIAYARHLAARVGAWDAGLAGKTSEADGLLEQARRSLAEVERWDREHSPAAFTNLSSGMLRAARWHTEKLASLITE